VFSMAARPRGRAVLLHLEKRGEGAFSYGEDRVVALEDLHGRQGASTSYSQRNATSKQQ
jgi:hypothetical protein